MGFYNRGYEGVTMPEYISTKEAAERLGVSRSRVLQFITEKRLPANKFGRDWQIDIADLALVRNRPTGYPAGKPRRTHKVE